MKKINKVHVARFVQLMAIVYLFFVLLADIMKWQQLDQIYVTLAICAIAVTTGSLKKLGDGKEPKEKIIRFTSVGGGKL